MGASYDVYADPCTVGAFSLLRVVGGVDSATDWIFNDHCERAGEIRLVWASFRSREFKKNNRNIYRMRARLHLPAVRFALVAKSGSLSPLFRTTSERTSRRSIDRSEARLAEAWSDRPLYVARL